MFTYKEQFNNLIYKHVMLLKIWIYGFHIQDVSMYKYLKKIQNWVAIGENVDQSDKKVWS